MLSLRTHNILDYVIAAVLMLSPYIGGFASVDVARNVFVGLGLALAVYSLLTRYYYSVAKIIPIGVHMTLDVLTGLALVLAPSFFNYRDYLTNGQLYLHYILGVGAFALVAVTRTKTETDRVQTRRYSTPGSGLASGPLHSNRV